jgi:hypothetical protein
MRELAFAIGIFFISVQACAERISTSEESLKEVAAIFQPVIESIDVNAPPSELIDETIEESDDGFLYLQGYKFSYQLTPEIGYRLKVYGFKRTFSIFSIFDCTNWLEYNPRHRYSKHKVVKNINGWALIEACHA